jgi:hypothetical protein
MVTTEARQERRREARMPLARPMKLRCVETGRYLAGQTSNLSASGALLEVRHPSLLVPGQRLQIGIAWGRGLAVIDSDQLAEATVVRSLALGSAQRVAVQFSHRQELALTA